MLVDQLLGDRLAALEVDLAGLRVDDVADGDGAFELVAVGRRSALTVSVG